MDNNINKEKKVELLSPAGDMFKLNHAIRYGADAVYFGLGGFNMRAYAGSFEPADVAAAVKLCHSHGVKAYLAVNTLVHEGDMEQLMGQLEKLSDPLPDAVIVGDAGVLKLVRTVLGDEVDIHVSTQMGVTNSLSALAFKELGAKRVVLARELRLGDISGITERVGSGIESEVFVHGAMCIAYSGRCLISAYLNGRGANSGACTQPCRWEYQALSLWEKQKGHSLIVEQQQGQSFVMSSKDLCMVEYIPELMECGIDSFKIEGRMKSAYYTAMTTSAYRKALDCYYAKEACDTKALKEMVESVSHREYSTGFFFDKPDENPQVTESGYIVMTQYIASATEDGPKNGLYPFLLKNKITPGMELELIGPGGKAEKFTAGAIYDKDLTAVAAADRPEQIYYLELPCKANPYDMLRTPVKIKM